jgi:hypothetical protein
MQHLRALAAGTLLGLAMPVHGQTTSPTQPGSVTSGPAPSTSATVTATGCLQLGADGKSFLLTNVRSAPGTVDSELTSPAAGTSATGDAPSGSVTGRTPTGSTAVTTPAPLPGAGTPGDSASPASPTYQQPSPAGTVGTVARTDTERREYRLVPGHHRDLTRHVGHTVEVTGMVRAADDEGSRETRDRPAPAAEPKKSAETRGATAARPVVQTLVVDQLRHLDATCTP